MRHPQSQKFHSLLTRIGELHDKKQADYGRVNDPFANVRASEDFGIPGWVGALVRMNDKMRRLQKAAQGGRLENESVEDSFLDLACYALIGLVLYQEQQRTPQEPKETPHDRLSPKDKWYPDPRSAYPQHATDPRAIRKGLFP